VYASPAKKACHHVNMSASINVCQHVSNASINSCQHVRNASINVCQHVSSGLRLDLELREGLEIGVELLELRARLDRVGGASFLRDLSGLTV